MTACDDFSMMISAVRNVVAYSRYRVHSTLDNGNICRFSGGSHHNYRERAAAGGLHADRALCGLRGAFPMTPRTIKTSKANLCRAANVAGFSLHFKEHGQK